MASVFELVPGEIEPPYLQQSIKVMANSFLWLVHTTDASCPYFGPLHTGAAPMSLFAAMLLGPGPPKIIPAAPTREIFVVQRIWYEPPARDEYAKRREGIARALNRIRRIDAARSWFRLENIKKRTGYVKAR
jgi:hypothetical protein